MNQLLALMVKRRMGAVVRPMPRIVQPDLIRGKYLVDMRHAIAPMAKITAAVLNPLLPGLLESARAERQDAGEAARARAAVEHARSAFFGGFREMRGTARQVGLATSEWQKAQLQRQLKAAVGITLPLKDPKLGPRLEHFTERNVSLIKSIPERYFNEVEGLVLDAVAKGQRWESLAKDIDERFDVGESRAKLIARDQVGKLFGALAQARQESLGIEKYTWRTMRDERVREEHQLLEGESFAWDDAPDEGHPGDPVNCRCWAEPDLDALLEQLEAA